MSLNDGDQLTFDDYVDPAAGDPTQYEDPAEEFKEDNTLLGSAQRIELNPLFLNPTHLRALCPCFASS